MKYNNNSRRIITRNKQLKVAEEVCPNHGYTYHGPVSESGWLGATKERLYVTCNSCGTSNTPRFIDIINRNRPCQGCSKTPLVTEIELNNRCSTMTNKFSYVGIIGKFNGTKSIVRFNCHKHGNFDKPYNRITRSVVCPQCSTKRKTTPEIITERCLKATKDSDIKFVRVSELKGYKSKVIILCPTHGESEVLYDNFHRRGNCPKCAEHGYSQDRPGYFYVVKHIKGDEFVYKFGITNQPVEKRARDHVKGVSWVTTEILFSSYYEDGSIPYQIESFVKHSFSDRIGVVDWLFSGNTETTYDIHEIMSYIM